MHRWIIGLVVLMFAVPLPAKTLEEVEKAVIEAMDKHRSIRCKVEMLQDVNVGMFKSNTSARGIFESKKNKDGEYRSRIEMKGKMRISNAMEQPMEMLAIDDGQYQYTMTVTGQRRNAIKSRCDPNNVLGGKQFFRLQRKIATLKLLPDEKIGNVNCYVVESTPKKPNPMFSRSVASIDKKTGIALKMAVFDKQGNEIMTMKLSDIRLNVDIPDARFVFKVPKGVMLRDMTKPTSRPASRPAGRGAKGSNDGKEKPDLEAILKQLQERRKQRGERRGKE